MKIKQLLSLSLLSSLALLSITPVRAQTNQSAATNINATGSQIAPFFVPIVGGSAVQTFSSGVQTAVNNAAALLNQLLAAGSLASSDLAADITPSSSAEPQLVLNVLSGDESSVAVLVDSLVSVPAAGSAAPAMGAPSSDLVEALVNSLVGLTADGQVDAGMLDQAVKAHNVAIEGVTDAAYLRKPPGSLLTIRAALGQLVAASGTSTAALPTAKSN